MDGSNNQLPVQPVQPVTPGAEPNAPKKKLSKGALWGIIGGAVALVVIVVVAVVVALTMGSKPTSDDYQKVVAAAGEVREARSESTKLVLSRAMLQYSNAMSNIDIAQYNQANDGENIAPQTVGGEGLTAVENQERAIAKKVAEKERAFDELATTLNDEDARALYDAYIALRTKLYGEGRTNEQFTEQSIQFYRISYACEDIPSMSEDAVSVDMVKRIVLYSEGCLGAVRGAQDSEALQGQMAEYVELMGSYLGELVDALRPMIAANAIDQTTLENISSTYEQKMNSMDMVESEESPLSEQVEAAFEKYVDMIVERRDA